jgi:hypothetical protein
MELNKFEEAEKLKNRIESIERAIAYYTQYKYSDGDSKFTSLLILPEAMNCKESYELAISLKFYLKDKLNKIQLEFEKL